MTVPIVALPVAMKSLGAGWFLWKTSGLDSYLFGPFRLGDFMIDSEQEVALPDD